MSLKIHPFLAIIWLTTIVVRFILSLRFPNNQGKQRFFEFRAFLLFSAVSDGALFVCSGLNLPWAYTYLWAIGSAIEQVLVVFVALGCVRSLGPFGYIPHGFTRRVVASVLPVAFVAVALFSIVSSKKSNWLEIEFSALHSCSIFIAAIFWAISFASDHYGIPWRSKPFGIALGFLFLYSVRLFLDGMTSTVSSSEISSLYALNICTTLVTSLVWTYFFSNKEQSRISLAPQLVMALAVETNSFKKTVQSISLANAGDWRENTGTNKRRKHTL